MTNSDNRFQGKEGEELHLDEDKTRQVEVNEVTLCFEFRAEDGGP